MRGLLSRIISNAVVCKHAEVQAREVSVGWGAARVDPHDPVGDSEAVWVAQRDFVRLAPRACYGALRGASDRDLAEVVPGRQRV